MSERAPYSRIYWSVIHDPKFVGIYTDDQAFALWVRLLLTSDAMWPAPAPLPRSARPKPLARLVDAGLIDIVGDDHYRVHGLDAERSRRQVKAAASASVRWNGSDANASQTHSERSPNEMLAETRRDETRQAEPANDDPEWLTAWYGIGRRTKPTEGQRVIIDAYLRAFDATGPARLAQLFWRHPDNPIGAAKDDLAAFRAERTEAAKAAEVPKATPRRGPSMPESSRELLAYWAKAKEDEGAA